MAIIKLGNYLFKVNPTEMFEDWAADRSSDKAPGQFGEDHAVIGTQPVKIRFRGTLLKSELTAGDHLDIEDEFKKTDAIIMKDQYGYLKTVHVLTVRLIKDWYNKFEIEVIQLSEEKPEIVAELAQILVYPWAQSSVINNDPLYGYSSEVEKTDTTYVEMLYFELDAVVDILSVFANLIWAMAITGSGAVQSKWQIGSGLHGEVGSWVDLTDEVSETSTTYQDKSRSGVISKITDFPTSAPITLRLVGKRSTATSIKCQIKSNTYLRFAVKTPST